MSGWYKTCTSSPRVSYRSRHAGEGLNTIQLHGERDSDIMCMFDMYVQYCDIAVKRMKFNSFIRCS